MATFKFSTWLPKYHADLLEKQKFRLNTRHDYSYDLYRYPLEFAYPLRRWTDHETGRHYIEYGDPPRRMEENFEVPHLFA
ncbi:MAG: hypothetical protein LBV38_01765 [Alistipes sp.]|jgi:hypothetical protein|nr:hypothetical protein [Alistipes sp.]